MRWFRRRRKAFIVTKAEDKAQAEAKEAEKEDRDSAKEAEQEEPKPAAVYDPDKE